MSDSRFMICKSCDKKFVPYCDIPNFRGLCRPCEALQTAEDGLSEQDRKFYILWQRIMIGLTLIIVIVFVSIYLLMSE